MSDVQCPTCNGPMWDNRLSKKAPNHPDFKCKNAPKRKGEPGCPGVIWPPKNAVQTPQQSPYSSPPPPSMTSPGAPPNFLAEQAADEQRFVDVVAQTDKLQPLFMLHDKCLADAVAKCHKHLIPLECAPQIAAATFIAAKDRGLAA